MATIRNITDDVLSLFRPDAPPVRPGDEVEISNETFAGRAWPKTTWALAKKPGKDFRDHSTEDAFVFLPADEEPPVEPTAGSSPETADTTEESAS